MELKDVQRENKTERINVRCSEATKKFMDDNDLSPQKIFDESIREFMEQEQKKYKQRKFKCDKCNKTFRSTRMYKHDDKNYCWMCYTKYIKTRIPNTKPNPSPLLLERLRKGSKILNDVQEEMPKKKIIKIDLLEGLTETQKEIIKTMTYRHKLMPLGWDVYVETGDMYYMGQFICSTKPIEKEDTKV